MQKRCIYLAPEHPQLRIIEALRARFDPSARLIGAHVTLVFPFASSINNNYFIDKMSDLAMRFDPIEFSLGQLICVDSYGFLPLVRGRRLITELHDQLYAGELKPFLSREFPYLPHLTVGRYRTTQECAELTAACEELRLFEVGLVAEMRLERTEEIGKTYACIEHCAMLGRPRESALDWLRTL